MIKSITISKVATFSEPPEVLGELSLFNFLFGSNGTGKSTIGRVIAEESNYPTCKVEWMKGTKLQPLVYNHDFIERNINQSEELKGVFTLGEQQSDTLLKIAKAKNELDTLKTKIETLSTSLQGTDGNGGKRAQLASIESDFKEKCWLLKQRLDGYSAQGAFKGYMGSKDSFKSKVLQEHASNDAELLPMNVFEEKAISLFAATPTLEPVVPTLDMAELLSLETHPILKTRVIGKEDVDVAAMIRKLGNSDWVREGRGFYEVNDRTCPFCQQSTSEEFAQSLNEYFDEAFVTNSRAIDALVTDYSAETARIEQQLAKIIASPSRFLNVERLEAEKELLFTKLILNSQRLAGKKREASQVVELESLRNVFTAIRTLIESTNTLVEAHNMMVANLASERATLTAQVWRFVLEAIDSDLNAYKKEKDGLEKAITAMTDQITSATTDRENKAAEIRELEKQTTSVQPTMDAINSLLSSFGFQGFKLAKADRGISYKLVRSDGTDAKATLSEGEKTFITFLYFYHLIKGSESESGMTTDRIVVFDDPVSSLDSDILFIVSSLIKGLFDEVRSKTGNIKQIFIFTHNVYFYKEVTYNAKRKDVAMSEETFWMVRKPGQYSKLDKHRSNPVKTSYELLWSEVRRHDRSNLAIQNTLRRILENYFKILGGIDFDELVAKFDEQDRTICKSLCSWVHDGSHNAYDDLNITISDSMVESYLKVFEAIFERSGHGAHYRMMMANAFVENATTKSTI